MSEIQPHHRKLAEALATDLAAWAGWDTTEIPDLTDPLAAALASERVVDPEKFSDAYRDGYQAGRKSEAGLSEARRESLAKQNKNVERLKAEVYHLRYGWTARRGT